MLKKLGNKIGVILLLLIFSTSFTAIAQNNQNERVDVIFNAPKNNEAIIGNTVIKFIESAEKTIDVAIYDINKDNVVDALMTKAKNGVEIRVLVDAKKPNGKEEIIRYDEFRLSVERLRLGADGKLNTADDIMVFSDSPIFSPLNNKEFPQKKLTIGKTVYEGTLIAEGEKKDDGSYYSTQSDMHNKFIVVDGVKVLTGSANFTNTSENHQQNIVILNSEAVANEFKIEFNQMWGSNEKNPNAEAANFGKRKTAHVKNNFQVGDTKLYVLGGLEEGTQTNEIECFDLDVFVENSSKLKNEKVLNLKEDCYQYKYDETNLLTEITDKTGKILISFKYDELGNLVNIEKGDQ